MKNAHVIAALLLALPLAATAQTKSTTTTTKPTTTSPATQQTTEVTEELDPATGKVIRRTTRTTTAPVGTTPGSTSTSSADVPSTAPATDKQVTDFFREKTSVSTLTAPALLDAYNRFMEKVHDDRAGWQPADWAAAAAVLSSLNGRYQQLRSTFTLDDKVTIRSQQAEFQALRTAKQISTSVSDKL